jgi:hypothetical protein
MPEKPQPEATIVILRFHEADASNQLCGIALEPQRPMPLFAALGGRQGYVATVGPGSIGRVGPRHPPSQEAHDLPVWKYHLDLLGIGKLQWMQPESIGLKCRSHNIGVNKRAKASYCGMRLHGGIHSLRHALRLGKMWLNF